ncbi:fluoride efflux transporter CrcB [Methylococcus capsulatus]|jgi:CrcB protein|uniref:Fluoride-specific ion channel FluC n=1 Tax=Methylococcus capsulatus TaxID=414 RepID=A0AA35Y1Q2_METCP|nr:fluoride efflux transporter CrcB [Methylococcus capsulatus]CAI8858793.1 putative fluoride ion transporter CrcB [Methylococcus capsulatus]
MNLSLFAIALGGAAGALARFWVSNGLYGWLGRDFPHGTLFINVSGSFLMGFLSVMLIQRFALAAEYRVAVLVGFLGAYTTFSTFSLETLALFEEGSLLKAALNVLLSVVLCLAAVWVGAVLARRLAVGEIAALVGGPGLRIFGAACGMSLLAGFAAALAFARAGLGPQLESLVLVALTGLVVVGTLVALVVTGTELRGAFQLWGAFTLSAFAAVVFLSLGLVLARGAG